MKWAALGVVIVLLLGGQMLANRQPDVSGVSPKNPPGTATEEGGLPVEVTAAAPTLTPTEEPGPVIDFTVKDLSGQSVSLSDLRGKVALVNFWATWCPPCKEEMPILQEYYLAHREQDFVLVGVNVSNRPEEVAAYVEEGGYVFPIWLDPPGNVLIDMGVSGLPVSVLVDAEGRVRKKWIGPLTYEWLDAEVTPHLSQASS